MKFGMRKISPMKSLKARTTGRAKRTVKKALIPGYGKKGVGWIKNLKRLHLVFLIYLNNARAPVQQTQGPSLTKGVTVPQIRNVEYKT